MRKQWILIAIALLPIYAIGQSAKDSLAASNVRVKVVAKSTNQRDSSYSLLVNLGPVFYTTRDSRINSFLEKYGYMPQQNVQTAARLDLSVVPFESKMMYSINAATVVSQQSIVTANFSLGASRRFFESKHFWFLAGLALGAHFDRVVLNGNLPPQYDSIAKIYHETLSLHRSGFMVEPMTKAAWYPLQWPRFQLGLIGGVGYDLDFNSKWRLGYYDANGTYTSFHDIKGSTTDVHSHQEFGWALNAAISACFKIY
jgi:hypothetical protein